MRLVDDDDRACRLGDVTHLAQRRHRAVGVHAVDEDDARRGGGLGAQLGHVVVREGPQQRAGARKGRRARREAAREAVGESGA